jgi:thiol-disulfide isomerase/thioredoxin
MVYATWCTHCQAMEPAFEAAAKMSNVPFVKVQGSHAPVTALKYAVTGYPTIFGVARIGGGPRRFAGMRTAEAFADFAKAIDMGADAVTKPVVVAEAGAAAAPAAPAQPVAVQPVQQAIVASAPAQAVVEAMPPTVGVVG